MSRKIPVPSFHADRARLQVFRSNGRCLPTKSNGDQYLSIYTISVLGSVFGESYYPRNHWRIRFYDGYRDHLDKDSNDFLILKERISSGAIGDLGIGISLAFLPYLIRDELGDKADLLSIASIPDTQRARADVFKNPLAKCSNWA